MMKIVCPISFTLALLACSSSAFLLLSPQGATSTSSLLADVSDVEEPIPADETLPSASSSAEIDRLKQEFLTLASITQRGFQADAKDRRKIKDLIASLERLNPTPEPAAPYYATSTASYNPDSPSLAGKWTLIYTDAPDITSLQSTPTAKLGRIGQECSPPYIKNVIEWRRPDWAAGLPFSGTDESRIIQKVCTKAKAKPETPQTVDLDLVGIELEAPGEKSGNLLEDLQNKGVPMGLLQANPIQLEGPLTTYFGQQMILYLDEDFRLVRTFQGYVAANVRDEEDWF